MSLPKSLNGIGNAVFSRIKVLKTSDDLSQRILSTNWQERDFHGDGYGIKRMLILYKFLVTMIHEQMMADYDSGGPAALGLSLEAFSVLNTLSSEVWKYFPAIGKRDENLNVDMWFFSDTPSPIGYAHSRVQEMTRKLGEYQRGRIKAELERGRATILKSRLITRTRTVTYYELAL